MTVAVIALSCAVGVLALLVAGLLRSHAEILRALHELGAGLDLDREGDAGTSSAPQQLRLSPIAPAVDRTGTLPSHLSGTTLDDEAVSLALTGGQDTLIAFLSSGCSTCRRFWDAFAGDLTVPGGARLVVVVQDAADESPSALRERATPGLAVVQSSQVWAEFQVPGSPYFVYVDGATGRIVGEGSAAGWEQVSDLMSQALADSPYRDDPGGRRHRLRRDEEALGAAGIRPGDPSLHRDPDSPVQEPDHVTSSRDA